VLKEKKKSRGRDFFLIFNKMFIPGRLANSIGTAYNVNMMNTEAELHFQNDQLHKVAVGRAAGRQESVYQMQAANQQLGILPGAGGPGYGQGFGGGGWWGFGQMAQGILKWIFMFSIIGGVGSYFLGSSTGLGVSVFFCAFSAVYIAEVGGPWNQSIPSTNALFIAFVVGVVAGVIATFVLPVKQKKSEPEDPFASFGNKPFRDEEPFPRNARSSL
jgi:hypothetical protein